ncbi:CoA transferase [Alcaligenaceae bacterium]|nr:CoA transferase [Alcaligenaceae bacterium]
MANTAFNGSDLLSGVKILEFSAIGPVPWGVSLLVDLGATVTRICRPPVAQDTNQSSKPADAMSERGRHDVFLDLKSQADRELALKLVQEHDVLIEGMRPGVMERLGLSPAQCAKVHPALVYARVTGWGQEGPLALRAGHDINYIALSGALHAIGPKDGPPTIPLNLVGDYGGGGAFMLIGILGGLLKARATGQGSVLDIAMIDGAARQMGLAYERLGIGQWVDKRGSNMLDGGSPWYSVYQTRCGGFMAVGAIEQQFYDELLIGLELDPQTLPDRHDQTHWDALRQVFSTQFLTRSRAEWAEIFDPKDACVSPVLSISEAPDHPHNQARNAFVTGVNGTKLPACAPRAQPI